MIQSAVNEEAALLSPKTVRNAAGLLTAALAMFDYKVDVTLPQKKKTEIVIPTDEEMKILCDKAADTAMMVPICLAAYMGMRRSEISALDLEKDVDLENKKLRISKAVVKNKENRYVLKGTKTTESERILPIPSILVPVFTDLIQNGKKIPNPDQIEKGFIKLRDSLGLKHITFHSLRHYFASTLVTLDIPDFYAMKLMGHNSDKMLKTVYQHVKEDYMSSVTQKMDDFFTQKNA
jgi:integrase